MTLIILLNLPSHFAVLLLCYYPLTSWLHPSTVFWLPLALRFFSPLYFRLDYNLSPTSLFRKCFYLNGYVSSPKGGVSLFTCNSLSAWTRIEQRICTRKILWAWMDLILPSKADLGLYISLWCSVILLVFWGSKDLSKGPGSSIVTQYFFFKSNSDYLQLEQRPSQATSQVTDS